MVENFEYPRIPGSTEIAEPSALVEDAPFGHCPACSSVGIEDGPSSESDTMLFGCSDFNCRVFFYETMPTQDEGKPLRGKGSERTGWSERKPSEVRTLEENMQSWNTLHFSQEFLQEHDLV